MTSHACFWCGEVSEPSKLKLIRHTDKWDTVKCPKCGRRFGIMRGVLNRGKESGQGIPQTATA